MEMKNNSLSSRIERKYNDYFKNSNTKFDINRGKIKLILPKIIKNYFLQMNFYSKINNENEFTNKQHKSIVNSNSTIKSNGRFLDIKISNSKEKNNFGKSLNSSKSDNNSDSFKNVSSLENIKTNKANLTNISIIKINPQLSSIQKISVGQQTEPYNFNNIENTHLKTVDNKRVKKFFINSKNKTNTLFSKNGNGQQKLSNFDPEIFSFQKLFKKPITEFCYKKFNGYKGVDRQFNTNCLIYMNNIVNLNKYKNYNIFDYKKDYKNFILSIQQKNISKYLEEIKDRQEKYFPDKHKENCHYKNIIKLKNRHKGKLKYITDSSRFNRHNDFVILKNNN